MLALLVFSWLHILLSIQIKAGDYIELSTGEEGYVVDIDWRNTIIKALGIILSSSQYVRDLLKLTKKAMIAAAKADLSCLFILNFSNCHGDVILITILYNQSHASQFS